MIKDKNCPVCGGVISFSYVRPDYDFYISEGKIEQDTNNELWQGADPYLDFYCSNDRTHDLASREDDPTGHEFIGWEDDVTREFYEKIWPNI